MSYIGNTPGVSSQRVVTEEVISGSPKSAFYPVGGYSLGYVDVLVNGLEVDTSDFTATDGVLVTLGTAAAVGDTVKIKCYLPRGLSDGYLKSEADARFLALSGGTLSGGVTFSQGANVSKSTGKQLTLSQWGDLSSADGGQALFAGNAYVDKSTGAWTYSNSHGSIGAVGVRVNSPGWNSGSLFTSGTTSATAGQTFTPVDCLKWDSAGNVALPTGNLIMSTGKGIDFSAGSNAAGMTSEVLSDYEEGSWTPDWRIGGNAVGTWVVKAGRYTKVGNMVTVWAYLYSSSGRGAGTGAVTINSLPFSSANSSVNNYHIMDARGGVVWSGGGAGLPYFYHPANTTYLIAYSTANGTGATTVQMTEANFSASSAIEINIMMTYETN